MSVATSHTLLGRLKDPGDHEAWNSFWTLYTPLIMGYCLRRGVPRHQAEDIVQETMIAMIQAIQEFEYNPSLGHFRGFLARVISHKICDVWRRRGREQAVIVADDKENIEEVASDDESIAEEWELRWRQALLLQALDRVEMKIHEQTMRAFQMYVLNGESADVVAKALGLTRNTVYQQKDRVTKLLAREVAFLEREDYNP